MLDDNADAFISAGAVQRLDTIVTRLRTHPKHPRAATAAEQLAQRVERHRAHDRFWGRVGCGVLAAVGLGLVAAIVYFVVMLP